MLNPLIPPIAFGIILALTALLSFGLSFWAFKNNGQSNGSKTSYSCGEEFTGHMIQPDYSQFFPFAFFFTVLHVVVMVIATSPAKAIESFYFPFIYIVCAVVGLIILLRR